MSAEVSELLKRLALAVLGQALPEASALDDIFRHTRKGFLFTIVTGVLISAGLLLACFGFYRFLVTQGLTMAVALSISLGLLILMAVIATLIADRAFRRVEETRRRIGFFPKPNRTKESDRDKGGNSLLAGADLEPQELLAAFLEGFLQDSHREKTSELENNGELPPDVTERATFTSFHQPDSRR
ncbi:hypothetical protein [Emcibacter sp.]|uniref:hypothetical protein n=1 Tax=Emcibacter sp. TaxID=1979954 RepID=UPI003A919A4A